MSTVPPPSPSPEPRRRGKSATANEGASARLLVLEAGRTERNYWSDLWAYRELFAILAWRDVAVQYKQSVIGVAWAVVRPLLTMIIFTVVFGRLAQLPSEGQAPYPVLVMAGMLPWFLFSTILGKGADSLVTNSNLVSKVYFPRLIVPASSALLALVDFAVTLLLLLGMMALFQFPPDWRILFLPLFAFTAILAALGPALILSSWNVRYRDFRFVVPFIIQFGLYISPVGFSSEVVPERWRLLYSVNPMVGVIDGFRWCLLGGESQIYWPGFAVSLLTVGLFLWWGIRVFRRTEKSFADLI